MFGLWCNLQHGEEPDAAHGWPSDWNKAGLPSVWKNFLQAGQP